MKSIAIGAGVMLLTMSGAWAVDCARAVATPDLNECAAREQKAVEARLNGTYQKVLKELEERDENHVETRKKLVAAQRAWIKFREADCDAAYQHYIDGSMRNLVYSGCMQQRAAQRIKELDAFLGP
jgi:uncharacterized protein YecT (DUF1311 family)